MVGESEGTVERTGLGIRLVVDRVAQGIHEHLLDTVTSHAADDRADEIQPEAPVTKTRLAIPFDDSQTWPMPPSSIRSAQSCGNSLDDESPPAPWSDGDVCRASFP